MDIIGKKFSVLNHGHIILLRVMGEDQDVVDAARTAYQKGTKHPSDDRTLIRYLMRHRHTSPFESCQLKFHIKLPIFIERQWARHRTAGWNEVSARYSELPEEYYVPNTDDIRTQSKTNRQGREEPVSGERAVQFQEETCRVSEQAFSQYHRDLEDGLARELSRINLPVGTYTEKVWWISLHNLFHFLGLRMDSHAQLEIQAYANVIGSIVEQLFPQCWEAFRDYRLEAMQLTRLDILVVQKLQAFHADIRSTEVVELCLDGAGLTNKREKEECIAKLKRLSLL